MKILYLQKQDLSDTAKKIVDVHRKDHSVTVINVSQDKDYTKIVDLIFSSDKVISW